MERARAEIERLDEPAGLRTLWFVVLAGPVGWLAGLSVDYALVRAACAAGTALFLHGVTLASLALVAAGGWVGAREWRRLGRRWPGEGSGYLARSRFMVALGLMASALFALVIVAQWLGKLFLHPCMGI